MGAFKNIHMEQQAMTAAINIIRTDMADHVNAGFPIEAYMPARAFSALVENGVNPWSLEKSPAQIIRSVLIQICEEALAA